MRTLIVFLVLALLAAVTTVIFALGNPGVVTVQFLKWNFDSSLTLLMLAPFAVGLLLGWLISVPTQIRKTLTIASNRKQISASNQELMDRPIADTLDTKPVV
jgi:putative membrane protein